MSDEELKDNVNKHNKKVYEEWENRDESLPYESYSAPRWREIPMVKVVENSENGNPTLEQIEEGRKRAKELFGDLIPDKDE